ncbi:MAG: hypothetical protein RBT49_04050 [Bacteroidales bacterium]|jgi:hypothetical protein|nr:hypothetical protein [Bacteroidales bacterium]
MTDNFFTKVDYFLTKENQHIISEKAKTKVDGIHSFRGIKYCVKSGKVVAFRDRGKIYEPIGGYYILVGYYTDDDDATEILKSYIRNK